ncbi:MAG: hypothetical protein RIR54_982, partial [Actinomycetota bacterium]
GLIVITPWFGESVFATTTAAQLGVAPFAVLWFGSIPSIALVTNVFALPVASFVMTVGPLVLAITALVPDGAASLLALPIVASARWVWWVADIGARFAPAGWFNVAGWAVIVFWAVRTVADEVRYVGHPRARL